MGFFASFRVTEWEMIRMMNRPFSFWRKINSLFWISIISYQWRWRIRWRWGSTTQKRPLSSSSLCSSSISCTSFNVLNFQAGIIFFNNFIERDIFLDQFKDIFYCNSGPCNTGLSKMNLRINDYVLYNLSSFSLFYPPKFFLYSFKKIIYKI